MTIEPSLWPSWMDGWTVGSVALATTIAAVTLKVLAGLSHIAGLILLGG
jgi:hypothetical protein